MTEVEVNKIKTLFEDIQTYNDKHEESEDLGEVVREFLIADCDWSNFFPPALSGDLYVIELLDSVRELNREEMTELALMLSLCPMHFIDYAICFDDETPECAAIRIIHPSHDT